jgi:predicted dehydrogenase
VGIAARRDRTRYMEEHYSHIHPAFLTAVHDIDLVLWLTGSRAVRVRALQHRRPGERQPDMLVAHLVLASGALVTINTVYCYPSSGALVTSDRIEVFGTAGVAVVDLSVPALTTYGTPTRYPDWTIEAPDGTGAFGAEIAHFCECLRAGQRSDIVSIDDAVAGIRIAEAMVRSADANGVDIWLEDEASGTR